MEEPLLLLDYHGGVARVTLNRPQKRNALSRELLALLLQAVSDAAAQQGLRAFVLEANGPAFCAGMDLDQMEKTAVLPDSSEQFAADTRLYREVVWGLCNLPVPTVAVVQGPALAGGMGLALACDMILAAQAARFALPEPKRGITAAVVAPLLVHRAGTSAASMLLLSGQTLAASDAALGGLCAGVVPDDQLAGERDRLIHSILQGAPGALSATKRWLLELWAPALAGQLERGMAISARAREGQEAREGLQAFLQHRAPHWASSGTPSAPMPEETRRASG
jgi:methylglutaconyl-CoA hydratase